MPETDTHHEAKIRRFLLGEMPEGERSAFESEFIADESLFERIRAGEDELVEAYARGTLDAAARVSFEKKFLATETGRERVRFTRLMLDKLPKYQEDAGEKIAAPTAAKSSIWEAVRNLFKNPALAFGAGLALLALLFGGWLLLRSTNRAPEIARRETPTPTVQNTNAPDLNPSPNSDQPINQNARGVDDNKNINVNRAAPNANQNRDAQNKNSTGEDQRTSPAPVLALFVGATRAGGKTSELKLPKNAPGATLRLNLESADYKIYSIEIVDPDGAPVFKSGGLKPRRKLLDVYVPAAKLAPGDYLVRLSARNAAGETDSVADYSFRVSQK